MKKTTLFCESLESRLALSVTPNDPLWYGQWGLKNSNIGEAWQSTVGSKNVVVAVVDSGIDLNHPDLKDNLWVNRREIPNNKIDDDKNGYVDDIYGWNFQNNNNNVSDDYGHGTHVSGIIGAKGNNSIGVAGVNWNVSIMSLKYFGAQSFGSVDSTIRAIDYATMMKTRFGVNVVAINASWGNIGYHKGLHDSINRAGNAGIVFVASAGNSSNNNDLKPNFPSSYDSRNVISVASTQINNSLSSFSSYGKVSVDIGSPGSNILSTKPFNKYAYMSGTSMAAPMVTGTVALMKSANPYVGVGHIKSIILASVSKVSSLVNKVVTDGVLNIGRAVTLAKNMLVANSKIQPPKIESMMWAYYADQTNTNNRQPATVYRVY